MKYTKTNVRANWQQKEVRPIPSARKGSVPILSTFESWCNICLQYFLSRTWIVSGNKSYQQTDQHNQIMKTWCKATKEQERNPRWSNKHVLPPKNLDYIFLTSPSPYFQFQFPRNHKQLPITLKWIVIRTFNLDQDNVFTEPSDGHVN